MNNILLSCNQNYYQDWAYWCAKSIQYFNSWINITVHLINSEKVDEIPGVRYVYEETDLSQYKEPVAYYQAARFIKVAELFDSEDLVMSIDCDTVCGRSFDKDEFTTISSQVSVLHHHKADRWLAGLITYGTDDFRQDYRSRLLQCSRERWIYGLDQEILEDLSKDYQFNEIKVGTWMSLGKGNGKFLTLKGSQKTSKKYLQHYNNILKKVKNES